MRVQHPRALPVIMVLIKAPPNRLFVLFSRVYDAWRISRVIRVRMDLLTFLRVVKMNLGAIFSFFLKADRHSKL